MRNRSVHGDERPLLMERHEFEADDAGGPGQAPEGMTYLVVRFPERGLL